MAEIMQVRVMQEDGSLKQTIRAVVCYTAPPEGLFPRWCTRMVPVPQMHDDEELHYLFGDLVPLIIRR